MIDRTSFEPLYIQVKKDILADIESGKIRPGDKLLSENEMLRHYNVGRMTIRAALSELMADGVIRKEQGRGSFCVGLPQKAQRLNIDVLLDSSDTYFIPAYMLKGISPVLEKNNCNLLMHDTKSDSEHITQLLKSILDRGTDGVMMQLASRTYRSPELDVVMAEFERREIPMVVLLGVSSYPYGICLSIDDEYGIEIATRYLLECGHRKILGLFYEKDRTPVRRVNGFRKAMESVPDAESYVITTPDYASQVLQLIREQKITAIQCYNDHVAVECLRLLVEHGIRVPQDISLVGFDDSELSGNSIPRLTTMSHPKDHLGQAAAEAILRKIRNPEEKQESVTYRPGLVIRQSVRKLDE